MNQSPYNPDYSWLTQQELHALAQNQNNFFQGNKAMCQYPAQQANISKQCELTYDFSHALSKMKAGEKWRRKGWKKGKYLYIKTGQMWCMEDVHDYRVDSLTSTGQLATDWEKFKPEPPTKTINGVSIEVHSGWVRFDGILNGPACIDRKTFTELAKFVCEC